MLDALLVTLTAVAAFGVAAIELHRPVAASGASRASARYALGRTALAAVVAALLALLAWRIAPLALGAGTSLAAGAVLLIFGLWRLAGAIAGVSTAPGGALDARSPDRAAATTSAPRRGAPMSDRGPAVAAAFSELLARWLSVALVPMTAALATGLTAAAIAGGVAALLALAALAAGPLRALLDRGREGIPALLVGVLLGTLGTLWAGAGAGIAWPGGGASILALFLGYMTVSVGAVEVGRQWTRAARPLGEHPLSGQSTEGG